jgi:hypothetical protein
MPGRKLDTTGKSRIRYVSRRAACARCPLRPQCLAPCADRRVIERWEYQAVIERHRARMAHAAPMMRCRKALVEHPFGTLKCRAGYRHFLLRGFAKVRGECSLMVLCYNFTRVLNIIGLDRFIAWLAIATLCRVNLLLTRAAVAFKHLRISLIFVTQTIRTDRATWLVANRHACAQAM